MPEKLHYRLKRDKLPGGDEIWTGYISLPTQRFHNGRAIPGKPIKLKATESSPRKAMGSTTKAAMKLLNNPMIRDLLPPGTQSAIAVASKLVANKKLKKVGKKAYKLLKSLW